jgi:hypothetical protein
MEASESGESGDDSAPSSAALAPPHTDGAGGADAGLSAPAWLNRDAAPAGAVRRRARRAGQCRRGMFALGGGC